MRPPRCHASGAPTVMVMDGRPARANARAVARHSISSSSPSVCPPRNASAFSPVSRRGISTSSAAVSTRRKVTVLSAGPSMNSCTWLCWSVAPTLAIGVGPTCRPSASTLPSDSAHNCTNHGARSRSASLYGIMTCCPCPACACARHCSVAKSPAALCRRSSPIVASRITIAPVQSASMSTPQSAAGSVPTGERTLKRPPTFGGTANTGMPSRDAIARSAPFTGSVTNARWRAASRPSRASRSRTTRYCASVSTVPPDLEITTNSVRGSATMDSTPVMVRGSTLSSTCSRGRPPRSSLVRAFHAAGSNADRSAMAPSDDPPMPSTTMSS